MKYLIRVIMTLPALILFGLRGVALLWKYGGIFHVNRYNPDKALGLLRDLHDIQNGPGLERDREEWEDVMRRVSTFLNQHETE